MTNETREQLQQLAGIKNAERRAANGELETVCRELDIECADEFYEVTDNRFANHLSQIAAAEGISFDDAAALAWQHLYDDYNGTGKWMVQE